jgi:hypothetical protein
MTEVTVELSEETLAALDARAATGHDGDRDEAAAALLGAWLERA